MIYEKFTSPKANKICRRGYKKDADYIFVSCSFPYLPTLPMICEAAAQSSIVFSQNEKPQIGFLLSLKDVEL